MGVGGVCGGWRSALLQCRVWGPGGGRGHEVSLVSSVDPTPQDLFLSVFVALASINIFINLINLYI